MYRSTVVHIIGVPLPWFCVFWIAIIGENISLCANEKRNYFEWKNQRKYFHQITSEMKCTHVCNRQREARIIEVHPRILNICVDIENFVYFPPGSVWLGVMCKSYVLCVEWRFFYLLNIFTFFGSFSCSLSLRRSFACLLYHILFSLSKTINQKRTHIFRRVSVQHTHTHSRWSVCLW